MSPTNVEKEGWEGKERKQIENNRVKEKTET